MDKISLILGVLSIILAINKTVRVKAIRIIFCYLSTFPILRLVYKNLQLFTFNDYFDNKTFDSRIVWLWQNGLFLYSSILALVLYVFYYYVLFNLFDKWVYKKWGNKIHSKIKSKNNISSLIDFFSNYYLSLFKFLIEARIMPISSFVAKSEYDTKLHESDLKNDAIGNLCLFVSIEYCLIFILGYNSFVIILTSLLILFLIAISAAITPMIYQYKKQVFHKTMLYLDNVFEKEL